MRHGGCDEALRRFDERTGGLGSQSGIRRIHGLDRVGGPAGPPGAGCRSSRRFVMIKSGVACRTCRQ
jgi:hypothetical protein